MLANAWWFLLIYFPKQTMIDVLSVLITVVGFLTLLLLCVCVERQYTKSSKLPFLVRIIRIIKKLFRLTK